MDNTRQSKFYLGTLGAILPFVLFVILVLYLGLIGGLSSKAAGAAAFCGFVLAFVLMKDKGEFTDLAMRGFTSHMLSTVLLAFLLAGVVAKLMDMGGLVKSLVWAAVQLGVDSRFMPLIVFVTGAVISSAAGTSGGTMAATTPILLPLSVELGCDANVIMGAVLSGAMFGDNIAPVSDTTIASALTQQIEVIKVVRSRLKYAFLSAGIAIALFVYVGFRTTATGASVQANMEGVNPMALLLLLVPVLVIILMLAKKGLIFSMTCGTIFGTLIALVFGLLTPSQILPGTGLIASGFESMTGIFPFFYFIFVLNEVLVAGGIFEKMISKIEKFATTPRRAEISGGLITSLGMFLISSPTVNIVTVGPMVRKLLKDHHIARDRGANILDGFSSGIGGTLPYTATALFPLSLAIATGVVADSYSVVDYVPYSFHCWALIAVFTVSVCTGFGRTYETAEEVDVADVI